MLHLMFGVNLCEDPFMQFPWIRRSGNQEIMTRDEITFSPEANKQNKRQTESTSA